MNSQESYKYKIWRDQHSPEWIEVIMWLGFCAIQEDFNESKILGHMVDACLKTKLKICREDIKKETEYFFYKIQKQIGNKREIEIEFRAKKRTRFEILDI